MKIEQAPLSSLVRFDRNSRVHSAQQVAEIAASIEAFGFTQPILVNARDRIIAGHGRLAAAEHLGLETVPVIRLAHLSDEQERALVIADNRIAENATWDTDLLAEELRALEEHGIDTVLLGFSEDELTELLALAAGDANVTLPGDPDAVGALPEVPVTRPGDLWILGEHRLVCGDSTSIDVLRCLCASGEAVDMIWTDPPYNVAYETKAGKIDNDDLSAAEFSAFLDSAFAAMMEVLSPGGAIYVAHADTEGLAFRRAFAGAGFKLSGCLVWVKPSLVLGRSDYQWRHEPILYGWKPGAPHTWHGGRAQTTVLEAASIPVRAAGDGTLQIDLGDQTLVVEGDNLSVRAVDGSVVRIARPRSNDVHPTMKPVDLIVRHLENSCGLRAVVLDPFGGSGSTLIACEISQRRARLCELSPRYCDVIVRRWEEATGFRASLAGTDAEGFEAVESMRR